MLGFDTVTVGNLLSLPTASSRDVRNIGSEPKTWLASRESLATTIAAADELLVAWGRLYDLGPARVHAQAQISWLALAAKAAGFDEAWSVGPDQRHPSRWHQYTADKYGRTSGGTSEQRLHEVLVSLPWEDVIAQVSGGRKVACETADNAPRPRAT
ncbi:hypothetical protein [Promicromonospora xylanilytica]